MDNRKEMDLISLSFPLTEVAEASAKLETLFEKTLEEVSPTIVLYALNLGEQESQVAQYAHTMLDELQQRVATANRDNYLDVVEVMSIVKILKWVQITMLMSMINAELPSQYVVDLFDRVGHTDYSEWTRIASTSLIPDDIRRTMDCGADKAMSYIREIIDKDLDL